MTARRVVAVAVAALLVATLAGCASSSPRSSTATVPKAQGGCGTTRPRNIGPKGVFIGVEAIAKSGVTGHQVLNVIPNDTVALWCVTVAFVTDISKKRPAGVTVQFLSKASRTDEQRAAAYLLATHLFSRVVIVKNPQHY
jgi:hypothetical protein